MSKDKRSSRDNAKLWHQKPTSGGKSSYAYSRLKRATTGRTSFVCKPSKQRKTSSQRNNLLRYRSAKKLKSCNAIKSAQT